MLILFRNKYRLLRKTKKGENVSSLEPRLSWHDHLVSTKTFSTWPLIYLLRRSWHNLLPLTKTFLTWSLSLDQDKLRLLTILGWGSWQWLRVLTKSLSQTVMSLKILDMLSKFQHFENSKSLGLGKVSVSIDT
jgi:hypothetical protein